MHAVSRPMPTRWTGRSASSVLRPNGWGGRPREMGHLLEQIAGGPLVSPAASAEMQWILQQQFYNTRLPQRIAERVASGHKTGDWGPIAGHDVGILYSASGPIVIALFITHNRGSFAELEATHGAIA